MATMHMLKTATGALVPANDESIEAVKKFKIGNVIKVDVVQMRNGPFFRKWWLLAQLAFDIWKDTATMPLYRGEPVQANFEKFRKDLTIMAGYYHPVANINSEVRLEADSLAWASMEEETFEKLYSATINAVLQKVLGKTDWDEDKLRNTVNQLMEFDR